MSRGQYAASRLTRDTELTLRAAADRMPPGFAFSGRTAAWLLGLDMPPCEPIEATVDRGIPVRARAGVRLRRAALPESDVIARRGFRSTSPLRTVRDLGSGRDLVESVVAIDMAVRARIVQLQEVAEHVAEQAGAKGIKRLRAALALADPRAESPMESRLRVELVRAGLPPTDVQPELHGASGLFLGRADLYYADSLLVVEYDGENHRDRRVTDLRRQNGLINAGYRVLRFSAADMRTPSSIVAQVGQALARHRGQSSR